METQKLPYNGGYKNQPWYGSRYVSDIEFKNTAAPAQPPR